MADQQNIPTSYFYILIIFLQACFVVIIKVYPFNIIRISCKESLMIIDNC